MPKRVEKDLGLRDGFRRHLPREFFWFVANGCVCHLHVRHCLHSLARRRVGADMDLNVDILPY